MKHLVRPSQEKTVGFTIKVILLVSQVLCAEPPLFPDFHLSKVFLIISSRAVLMSV